MLFSLIPREMHFFELLAKGGENAHQAALEFQQLIHQWSLSSASFQKIRAIENEGDLITHEIIDRLNRTFITPIDREDIHELAGEIDDICDILQALSDRMQLYELGNKLPEMILQMVDSLAESTRLVAAAINEIRNFRRASRIRDHCIKIKGIENEADELLKHALAHLFKSSADPMYVMKWKEIYESVERAHDKCSSIANTLESIVVKNA